MGKNIRTRRFTCLPAYCGHSRGSRASMWYRVARGVERRYQAIPRRMHVFIFEDATVTRLS